MQPEIEKNGVVDEEPIHLVVKETSVGMRLDRYVADMISDLSRTYARQLIEDAHILLNGCEARPSTLVQLGDVVTVRRPLAQPTDLVAEAIPLNIVYEDADVVVDRNLVTSRKPEDLPAFCRSVIQVLANQKSAGTKREPELSSTGRS